METLEALRFLNNELAYTIAQKWGTPVYVYDLKTLRQQAEAVLAFPHAYGLTARFAMKACPNSAILQLFSGMGLHFDASSGYEAWRAILAGIAPEKISLSSQEYPQDFDRLYERGIEFNACSLNQLELFGQAHRGAKVGLRFNPGLGSGGTGKTNVGGSASSFGIWYELIEQVKKLVNKFALKVVRIHTHIGSGSDPVVWQRASGLSLDLVRAFPDVVTLNLGGGYKVGRMVYEKTTDLQSVGGYVRAGFEKLFAETGRAIKLEIEPGTYLVANTCTLLSRIQDMTTTGNAGYTFLKLDCGMTDVLRPSLYGAQHPIVVIPNVNTTEVGEYIVVGHCCESGDLLTPAPGEPESLAKRKLLRATIGDLCAIEGAGAYCSSMSTINYNSFPQIPEVLVDEEGCPHLIRQRQSLEQIVQNEVAFKF